MSDPATVTVLLDLAPDLPSPYVGWYERHIVDRTGDAYTVLTVWERSPTGVMVFVRSFTGPYMGQCDDEFLGWANGLVN